MTRASDDTRERTVASLRAGLAEGRLGLDTFVRRIEEAYAAKSGLELARLTADLPQRTPWWLRLARRRGDSCVPARLLRPPVDVPGTTLTLGRAAGCDFLVADLAVSATHAELRRTAEGWFVRDLDSRNGTRVNGWLVDDARLHDGDELLLGKATFVFREPRA